MTANLFTVSAVSAISVVSTISDVYAVSPCVGKHDLMYKVITINIFINMYTEVIFINAMHGKEQGFGLSTTVFSGLYII